MKREFNIKNILGNKKMIPIEELKKEPEVFKVKMVSNFDMGKEEFIIEQFIYDVICTDAVMEKDKNGDAILTTKSILIDPQSKRKICDAFEVRSNLTQLRVDGDCSTGKVSCKSSIGNLLIGIINMIMPDLCINCVAPFWEKGESLADLVEKKLDGKI